MIRFDKNTENSWKERSIKNISIRITNTGCAGHKIQVEEWINPDIQNSIIQGDMNLYISVSDLNQLENSLLTWTGKKWILVSEKIHTRCGCGSSFSLKSGNPIQDKITQMKLAMKEKKEWIHNS